MKNIIIKVNGKIALLLLSVILGFASCKNYLEVAPKTQVADDVVWSTTQNADLFLNNIYASLPDVFNNNDPEDNWTDNAMAGLNFYPSRTVYARSVYTASNAPSYWNEYDNIRKCNLFITKASGSDLPDDWKKLRLAEARFLRAYFYELLWTHYGGVPLITDVLDENSQGDSIFRARNTDDETFKFITDECAAIANDLPLTAEDGRITKGAALTLKGWCELFEASTLKNPGNDQSKWAAAAATNKEVIDLGVYSLFPDYETMLFEANNNNEEVIFDRAYLGGVATLGSSKEGLWGIRFAGGTQVAYGGVNPSQELVDDYEMANGLPISDPASGYDPQNPYVNREKRFYQSILYDGSTWLGFDMIMKQGVGSRNATDLSNANEGPNTGYALRKGLDPQYAVNGYNHLSGAHYVIFRYGEVLLSYAEAQNEAIGPDASVYDAVNSVRSRSALPPLPQNLNQNQMREAIRRERRVELAFEDKRWYDLIRWKIAEKNLNGTIHGILIEKENNKWVYKVIPAPDGTRIFYADKNYLFPIPQGAMDQNANLTQNPNY